MNFTKVGLIYEEGATHIVVNKSEQLQARLKIGVIDSRGENVIADPFNFRLVEDVYEFRRDASSEWETCTYGTDLYCDQDNQVMEFEGEPVPLSFIEPNLSNIEILSCVLVYLPTDSTQTYSLVKLMSHFQFGVPSQCAVRTKFEKQRAPEQYCANIALKLNAKLTNKFNKSRAWRTSFNGLRELEYGIPWVKEVPTMVFGIHISNSLGQDGISIIAATVGLDGGLMQFAQDWKVITKTDIIPKDIMENIFKVLLAHFVAHNIFFPKRILMYRDGVSDGNFPRVYAQEILGIKKGCIDFFSAVRPEFNGRTPPITCVVCQTQHSIRVVPAQVRESNKNVFSGTCVDSTIMSPTATQLNATRNVDRDATKFTLFEESNSEGYDFLLTAHGGLKGTSKPVYYRTILNENAVWKVDGPCTPLTREKLQLATYHQSFQYGTASKAVRSVPVCFYSKRLSNMVMGYISYIRENNSKKGNNRLFNGDYPLAEQKMEELDESEKKYERKQRDGTPHLRDTYVRKDIGNLEGINPTIKSVVESMSQFTFSPFNSEGVLRPPLRPHMSA